MNTALLLDRDNNTGADNDEHWFDCSATYMLSSPAQISVPLYTQPLLLLIMMNRDFPSLWLNCSCYMCYQVLQDTHLYSYEALLFDHANSSDAEYATAAVTCYQALQIQTDAALFMPIILLLMTQLQLLHMLSNPAQISLSTEHTVHCVKNRNFLSMQCMQT